jgi:hypothetical protein
MEATEVLDKQQQAPRVALPPSVVAVVVVVAGTTPPPLTPEAMAVLAARTTQLV